MSPDTSRIELYWIPLGAGGSGLVRVSGRLYETWLARAERRRPLDLYHTALEVRVPEGRYTIENAWPSPDPDLASRGVAVAGPVWSRWLGRHRWFRYEVRCWKDGRIPDVAEAVESPQIVSGDVDQARLLIELAATVPPLVWGRDLLETGEMWNSNSVISYLLSRAGVDARAYRPPAQGRAPGWQTGVVLAQREGLAGRRPLPRF
jgi:hypothetical protein